MMSLSKFVTIISIFALMVGCGEKRENRSDQASAYNEWARPAVKGGNTAAYFVYVNEQDAPDTLVAVESSDAAMVQVHETYESEDGMMGMREVDIVPVGARDSIQFKQGGLHIMFMQIKKSVGEGDSLHLKIIFQNKGSVMKSIPVKPSNYRE